MKKHLAAFSIFCFAFLQISAEIKISINYKSAFYDVIASSDTTKINHQVTALSALNIDCKQAYIGALLMKKSGLVKTASQKLKLFKEGKKKLEQAISLDQKNAEYRFLRLMIQENCPPILKYNGQITEDLTQVKSNYKKFDPVLKKAVLNYSKNSKYLKESDL